MVSFLEMRSMNQPREFFRDYANKNSNPFSNRKNSSWKSVPDLRPIQLQRIFLLRRWTFFPAFSEIHRCHNRTKIRGQLITPRGDTGAVARPICLRRGWGTMAPITGTNLFIACRLRGPLSDNERVRATARDPAQRLARARETTRKSDAGFRSCEIISKLPTMHLRYLPGLSTFYPFLLERGPCMEILGAETGILC